MRTLTRTAESTSTSGPSEVYVTVMTRPPKSSDREILGREAPGSILEFVVGGSSLAPSLFAASNLAVSSSSSFIRAYLISLSEATLKYPFGCEAPRPLPGALVLADAWWTLWSVPAVTVDRPPSNSLSLAVCLSPRRARSRGLSSEVSDWASARRSWATTHTPWILLVSQSLSFMFRPTCSPHFRS
jgi:hypothetical protein